MFISIITISLITVSVSSVNDILEDTTLANHISYKNGQQFYKGCCVTLEKCLKTCKEVLDCQAIFHNAEIQQCNLYSAAIFLTTDAFFVEGWRYFRYNCPQGWVRYDSKCYFISDVGDTGTWDTVVGNCETKGGKLVEIISESINNFLKRRLKQTSYWIGGKLMSDGIWRYHTSLEELVYYDWFEASEPNYLDSELCIMAHPDAGHQWFNERCSSSYNYICESSTV